MPVAYYLGCSSNGLVQRRANDECLVLLICPGQQLPDFATRWHAHR